MDYYLFELRTNRRLHVARRALIWAQNTLAFVRREHMCPSIERAYEQKVLTAIDRVWMAQGGRNA